MNLLMIIKWEQLLLHHEDFTFHYLAKKIMEATFFVFTDCELFGWLNVESEPKEQRKIPRTKNHNKI